MNAVGGGRAYYVATVPDAEGTVLVARHLLAGAEVEPVIGGLPSTVEAARRGDVVTVINHGDGPAPLVLAGTDLVSGEVVGAVTLAPFAYRVMRQT